MINNKFWESKKILVTGHTGFKGGWLCLWLQSLGARVYGISLEPSTNPSLFELAKISDGMDSYVIDIRDYDKLNERIKKIKPEIVIHMAAQPLVRKSYLDPMETYQTNIMGTVNLLESIRKIDSVRAIVNITTDKCYDNNEWIWSYRESDKLGGFDPYSSSKACSEIITNAFRQSFLNNSQILVATARAGNVIGGGDWSSDRLIPDILKALSKKETIKIRNPNAIRPWQHVLEPISGYLLLCERLCQDGEKWAEAWNFGPEENQSKSVSWIVDRMCQKWGDNASWILDKNIGNHEAENLRLDISKSKYILNWSPKWHLDQTLDEIINWHKKMLNGDNMKEVILKTIRQYEDYEI